MKRTNKLPLLYMLGTMALVGAATCLFVYHCFDEADFELDTYDEHSEDYL
ncbi:hypothetical protein [Pontibacter anaerobius]|uniref:Lipoprotein n=1 Tax=Pontibacter anaerobius TaxID=2993940 RepID=A0ABT3RJN4_9BACT|nr:hypothetical protein [Pontibacter anaerobius]MCX2741822.1 hypothetical protein [Pontibacter anaerobius]